MDFAGGMFFVALPYLAMQLGARSLELGLLGAARGLTYAISCVGASLISDRSSRGRLVTASSLSVVLMFWATAYVTGLWQLFATTILLSVAFSFYWPSLLAWVGDSHSTEELGAATGAVNVSWSVGGMIGGLVAGSLFALRSSLPFLAAGIPALMACIVSWFVPRERPGITTQDRHQASETVSVSKKELVGAWLGSLSAFSIAGLMYSVFPKLGSELGITSAKFGVLIFLTGCGRTLTFALGTRWSRWLRDWRLCGLAQLAAVGMVATVCVASAYWWLAVVFVSVGLATGAAYYRSLYMSLEGEGSRGLNSGLHEAILFVGILSGSVGGGAIAHVWHLRAPYVPIAGFALLILIVQIILTVSAHRAEYPDAPAQ